MNHLDRFLKSKGTVTSRDRDVVVIKFLKNINSKSFFKFGGGVCTNKNSFLSKIKYCLFIVIVVTTEKISDCNYYDYIINNNIDTLLPEYYYNIIIDIFNDFFLNINNKLHYKNNINDINNDIIQLNNNVNYQIDNNIKKYKVIISEINNSNINDNENTKELNVTINEVDRDQTYERRRNTPDENVKCFGVLIIVSLIIWYFS